MSTRFRSLAAILAVVASLTLAAGATSAGAATIGSVYGTPVTMTITMMKMKCAEGAVSGTSTSTTTSYDCKTLLACIADCGRYSCTVEKRSASRIEKCTRYAPTAKPTRTCTFQLHLGTVVSFSCVA